MPSSQDFQLLHQIARGNLARSDGRIQIAVRETGTEPGELDPRLRAEPSHAQYAERSGTVLVEQRSQGSDVFFGHGKRGDLDHGAEVGSPDHDLLEFVAGRSRLEIVVGDNERALVTTGQCGNLFQNRAA